MNICLYNQRIFVNKGDSIELSRDNAGRKAKPIKILKRKKGLEKKTPLKSHHELINKYARKQKCGYKKGEAIV